MRAAAKAGGRQDRVAGQHLSRPLPFNALLLGLQLLFLLLCLFPLLRSLFLIGDKTMVWRASSCCGVV